MYERGSGVKGFFLLAVLLLLCPYSPTQDDKKTGKASSKQDQSPFTFKIPVDVVVVNVTVTDKRGKPVLDLTADDFKIFEDGKPQPIHTFTLETYKATQPLRPAGAKPGSNAAGVEAASSDFIQPRMFSMVIDDVTTPPEHFPQVYKAVRQFVEEDLIPGDLVAIVTGSGSVQHPFTGDRQLLLAEIGDLFRRVNVQPVSRSACPQLTDLQAQRIANEVRDGVSLETATKEACACAHLPQCFPMAELMARSEASAQFHETQYRNRVLLGSLRRHVRSLKHFEAKKSVVLFSDGFLFQELTYDLQDVVDQALRSGVVFNAVDVRGLYVPMFEAANPIADLPQDVMIGKARLLSEDMSSQEDALVMLAHDTGGIFHHNSNDLHAGLKQIADREAHYYVLSYATPSQKPDGRYHKIKLEIARPGLELAYRRGYYAPKEELTFERKRKEDILEALRAPGNVNEIPVGFSYNSSQVDDSNYEVELITRVDIRRMQFAEEDSWRKNLISLVIVAFDEADRYVDGVQKDVSFNLSPSSYNELVGRGFSSKVNLRVPPGRYKIRSVVRESVQSKMGSLTKYIDVP